LKSLLKTLITLLFRVKTINFNKLNIKGRVIIMPNHPSLLDGVFLYLFLPKEAVFVINTEMARRFSFFLKHVNYFTIDPLSPYSIRKIINVVNENVPVVLFPEGRVTTTKGLMKIYDGVGFLAAKTGAAIYPLIINGLEHSKFSRIRDKVRTTWFPQVRLFIDEPVQLKFDKTKNIKTQKRDASERILAVMQTALFNSR
jgi:acyl-[acyl-carrier-protein]-phospholipid O-acyltransferase/long-chain-fatty-acid--[acyl-carrier-protein] ligase